MSRLRLAAVILVLIRSSGADKCHACLYAPAFTRLPLRACLYAPAFTRLLFSLVLLLIGARFCTAEPISSNISWDTNAQGGFITSLCRDTHGNVWIGTEDKGVYRLNPDAPKDRQYTKFTHKDGVGDDNIYALVCDKAGRVWAGTLNHGVSVYNGKQWKTYGPIDGPLGSRVFALAVNPIDGGVWGATEAGLFQYRANHWTYFTRADGLPSDQANALAFSQDGTLYVGTQCDGIAIASSDDHYKSWHTVPGPDTLPTTPVGKGLPSALINVLLVSADNTVYAGTDRGLAWSRDEGAAWTFTRGKDWKPKLSGLLHPITPAPVPASLVPANLLAEDYVTCLAEDASRGVWVGHRQQGIEIFDPRTPSHATLRWVQSGANGVRADDYVNCLLAEGKDVWAGLYGGGFLPPLDRPNSAAVPVLTTTSTFPALPVPAKPPTLAELNAMLCVISAVAPDKTELQPKVVALTDDWQTQGDWLGRYGRYWACLNAICSPQDYLWGAGWETVNYFSQIGPNADKGDGLRYWVQWLYTNNPRVLELPPTYLDSRIKKGLTTPGNNRREAEQDDHGEAYPQSKDGPNIYTTLSIPNGLFTLSLYDLNYNGHGRGADSRDYIVSLRSHPTDVPISDISSFEEQPELAHSRIAGFWGGVWKRFLVRGPQVLTIEINRHHSMNAMLPAIMLDLVDETPPPYFGTVDQWEKVQISKEKQRQQVLARGKMASFRAASTAAQAAVSLALVLNLAQNTNSLWWGANSRRFYGSLLRWYLQAARPSMREPQADLDRHLATCFYQTGHYQIWEEGQKRLGMIPARQIEYSLIWDGINDAGQDYQLVKNYFVDSQIHKNHLKMGLKKLEKNYNNQEKLK